MIDFNIDNYLRISWQDVLLVCISSFIIVVVCRHYFWNKLLAFIQKRQALIQENIDASEKLKVQAREKRDEYDAQLAQAGQKANAIIDQARAEAVHEKNEIIASARTQAENIERAAREDVVRDQLRAQAQMKNAITDVAFAAAGQILEAEIDEQKQKDIVDRIIEQAGEGKW